MRSWMKSQHCCVVPDWTVHASIRVSNLTGEGLDNLVVALERLAVECAARPVGGNFRLAVDRHFTLPGAGLVVTGAAIAGRVRTGDRLLLSPQGLPVRVRGLRVQNELAQVGAAGDRCALNLAGAGVHKSAVHRGDWVVAAAAHAPTDRLDACFRLLATEARPLRNSTPVHLHLGAAHLTASVAVLEGRSIAPGGAAPVQLVLDRAIGALRGDRFVLRDAAARHTIGGGVVLDPFPPARGRARPERLTVLAAQAREDPAAALGELLAQTPVGVDLGWFRAAWNLTDAEGAALWTRAGVVRTGDARGSAGFTPGHWVALKNKLLETVGYWHERSPQVLGLNEDALCRALPLRVAPAALGVAIRQLVGAGFLARHGTIVHLPGHRVRPTPAEAAAWARVRPLLEAGGLRPPLVWQLAEALGEEADAIQRFLVRAAELGLVLRVTEKRFFPPPAIAQLAAIAEAVAAAEPDGLFTAAAYRDAANVGRNLSISLLEYFDRAGLTQRIGEGRRLLRSAAELFAMGENEAPAEDAEGAC